MATELAAAYVTIMPSLKGAAKTITNELNGIDGKSIGGKLGTNISVGLSSAKIAIGNMVANAASAGINAIASNLDSAVSRVDSLNRFPLIMQQLGLSADDAKAATTRLSDGIEGLPTTLDTATNGVTRFVAKNGDINKSTSYFLALNDALVAGGQSTEIQSAAMEQLMQSYSKGKMDMVEWRSIQTAMPQVLNQVAAAMGTTSDALGEGLRDGTISMDEFMDTLVKLDTEGVNGMATLSEQAKVACGGIKTSFVNLGTAITKNLASVITVINGTENGLSESGGRISNLFNSMKIGINTFGNVAVIATKAIVNAFGSIREKVSSVGSSISAFISHLAEINPTFAGICSFASEVSSAIGKIGSDISNLGVQGALDAFKSRISSALPLVQSLASAIKNALPIAPVIAFAAAFGPAMSAVTGFLSTFGGLAGFLSAGATQLIVAKEAVGMFASKIALAAALNTSASGTFLGLAKTIGTGLSGALAGLVSPVGIVVAAILALGAAFAYLFTTNETFRSTVISLGQSILVGLAPAFLVVTQAVQNLAVTVGPALLNIFNMIVPVLGQIIIVIMEVVAALAPVVSTIVATLVPILTVVIQLVTTVVETVVALVMPIISQVLAVIQMAMPLIQAVITAVMGAVLACIELTWPAIQAIIETVMNVISVYVQTVWPVIETIITTAMNVIQAVISTVMAIISGDWSGAWNGILQLLSSIVVGVGTLMAGIMQAFLDFCVLFVTSAAGFFASIAVSVGEFLLGIIASVGEFMVSAMQTALEFFASIISSAASFFSSIISGLADTLSNMVSALAGFVASVISDVSGFIASIIAFFKNLWSNVTNLASLLWNSVKSAFSSGVSSVKSFVSGMVSAVVGFFGNLLSSVSSTVSSLVSSVVSFFGNLYSNVTSTASNIWNHVVASFVSGVSNAVSAVAGLPGRIIGIFSGVGDWLVSSGRSLIDGFVNGITGAIDWAASTVEGCLSRIRGMFPFSPAKEGPFCGRGWVLYSGMSTAKAFGEGFAREADNARAMVERSLSDIRYGVNADAQSSGSSEAELAAKERMRASEDEEMLVSAIYDAVSMALSDGFDVNVDKREFGRMVRAYA